ncbi:MAG: hypothetical protein ACREHC_02490 [Candidatus Levyibacteriota bacterium]
MQETNEQAINIQTIISRTEPKARKFVVGTADEERFDRMYKKLQEVNSSPEALNTLYAAQQEAA